MKMVNNAINGGCRMATLEMVALGRKAGLSLAAMTEVLNAGAGHNQTTEKMLPAIARGEASTNFALSLMLKDINQAVELGDRVGAPMAITRTVRGLLQVGLNTVGPAARLEDMVSVVEGMAGTRFAGPGAEPGPLGDLPDLIDRTVWATCRAITCECMNAGLRYGLALDAMVRVLAVTSGWSVALRELGSAALEQRPSSPLELGAVTKDMRRVAGLSIQHGTPVFIPSIATAQYEQAQQRFGTSASVDEPPRALGLLRPLPPAV
jgi:3-hydroxyisobutyrate dehydrogenase